MYDYGSYVHTDDEDEVEDVEENTESLIRYLQPTAYFPICIGYILFLRYCLEHKLGHGGFSTVWMAHDIEERKTSPSRSQLLPKMRQTLKELCTTKSASVSRTRPNFSFLKNPSRSLPRAVAIES